MGDQKLSFTADCPGIANMLMTPCGVCESFDPKTTEKHPEPVKVTALWDTGATGTVISSALAQRMNLTPQGQVKSYNANGDCITNVYYLNIILPNSVGIPALRVTEGILKDFDILIGMDIISRGDFAICNSNGKTKFTFQIPSSHDLDFVKENNEEIERLMHTPITMEKKPERNGLCPCKSGKKYKKCCGQ